MSLPQNRSQAVPNLLAPRTIVRQRFQIERMLSQTPRQATYLAHDLASADGSARQTYVIKQGFAASSGWDTDTLLQQQSLRQEGIILSQLSHPQIVPMRAHFEENANYYIVQDYPGGCSLEEAALLTMGDNVEQLALQWIIQVCTVIEYLHTMKPSALIHRDIRPARIIIAANERIVLADLSSATWQLAQRQLLPNGDARYMAPEQRNGEATPQTDIYSIGATLSFLLTREHPAIHATGLLARRALAERRNTLHPGTASILQRTMTANPANRFRSVAALRGTAVETLAGLGVTYRPIPALNQPTGSSSPLVDQRAAPPAASFGSWLSTHGSAAHHEDHQHTLNRQIGGAQPRYQDALRAVGLLLEAASPGRFGLREVDQGIEVQAEPLLPGGPRLHRTFAYEELRQLARQARQSRGSSRHSLPTDTMQTLWPSGFQDGLRALGAQLDMARCLRISLLQAQNNTILLNYVESPDDDSPQVSPVDLKESINPPLRRIKLSPAAVTELVQRAVKRRGTHMLSGTLALVDEEK